MPKEGKPEEAPPPAPEPVSTAALPLTALAPNFLGAFFELCFPDRRLVDLCNELRLTTPGYRLESLPPDEVGRVLADEYLEAEDVRAPLEKAVREVLRSPPLEASKAGPKDVDDLVDLVFKAAVKDPLQQMARIAWRCLMEEDAKMREMALVAIEDGVKILDAQQPQGKKKTQKPAPDVKEARAALKQAERAEKDREAMKEQLASARVEIAAREARLAEQKGEVGQLRAETARLTAEVTRLTEAGAGKALADARRFADEARALGEKLRVAEEEMAEASERAEAAERALAQRPAQTAAAQPGEELPDADESAEFLVPVLTREFYESIERWDRRIQKAAFDKIHLLAQNWRHGSLRALQLEGIPGYYRIRIATDVRLIYRREGARIEVLSLIDREDLDRYIRQARTRTGDQRSKSEAPDAR